MPAKTALGAENCLERIFIVKMLLDKNKANQIAGAVGLPYSYQGASLVFVGVAFGFAMSDEDDSFRFHRFPHHHSL